MREFVKIALFVLLVVMRVTTGVTLPAQPFIDPKELGNRLPDEVKDGCVNAIENTERYAELDSLSQEKLLALSDCFGRLADSMISLSTTCDDFYLYPSSLAMIAQIHRRAHREIPARMVIANSMTALRTCLWLDHQFRSEGYAIATAGAAKDLIEAYTEFENEEGLILAYEAMAVAITAFVEIRAEDAYGRDQAREFGLEYVERLNTGGRSELAEALSDRLVSLGLMESPD